MKKPSPLLNSINYVLVLLGCALLISCTSDANSSGNPIVTKAARDQMFYERFADKASTCPLINKATDAICWERYAREIYLPNAAYPDLSEIYIRAVSRALKRRNRGEITGAQLSDAIEDLDYALSDAQNARAAAELQATAAARSNAGIAAWQAFNAQAATIVARGSRANNAPPLADYLPAH